MYMCVYALRKLKWSIWSDKLSIQFVKFVTQSYVFLTRIKPIASYIANMCNIILTASLTKSCSLPIACLLYVPIQFAMPK